MMRFRGLLVAVIGAYTMGGCEPEAQEINLPVLTEEEGFSFHIPPFEVPYGEELQQCYFITMPQVGEDEVLWVDRVQVGLNPGSHHFNMYRVLTETALSIEGETAEEVDLDGVPARLVRNGECLKSSNWNEWPLVVNSQQSTPEDPYLDWELPEGVAFPLRAGETLMLQPHYVNVGTQRTPGMGQVRANFHRADANDTVEMGTLFATQQSIRVCESTPNPTFYGACSFPSGADVHIAAVNGHFHLRGTHLGISTWDGTSVEAPPASAQFYESFTWQDPVMTTGLDIPVADGGGIWWSCEYEWRAPITSCEIVNGYDGEVQDDCCYTFGPRVEEQEHCNVFLYYYPRVADTDVYCN